MSVCWDSSEIHNSKRDLIEISNRLHRSNGEFLDLQVHILALVWTPCPPESKKTGLTERDWVPVSRATGGIKTLLLPNEPDGDPSGIPSERLPLLPMLWVGTLPATPRWSCRAYVCGWHWGCTPSMPMGFCWSCVSYGYRIPCQRVMAMLCFIVVF